MVGHLPGEIVRTDLPRESVPGEPASEEVYRTREETRFRLLLLERLNRTYETAANSAGAQGVGEAK